MDSIVDIISTNNFAKRHRNVSKENFLYLPPHPRPTTPPHPATPKQSTKLKFHEPLPCTYSKIQFLTTICRPYVLSPDVFTWDSLLVHRSPDSVQHSNGCSLLLIVFLVNSGFFLIFIVDTITDVFRFHAPPTYSFLSWCTHLFVAGRIGWQYLPASSCPKLSTADSSYFPRNHVLHPQSGSHNHWLTRSF